MADVKKAHSTGWLDDVAVAAVRGNAPFVFAVVPTAVELGEVVDWLRSAAPSVGDSDVRVSMAESLGDIDGAKDNSLHEVFIIKEEPVSDQDAAKKWQALNLLRERLAAGLGPHPAKDTIVFVVTEETMRRLAQHAPDLLSVSEVISVTQEPFAVEATDGQLLAAYQAALGELESKYGISTREMVRRVTAREDPGVPPEDVARWLAAAQALRNVSNEEGQ